MDEILQDDEDLETPSIIRGIRREDGVGIVAVEGEVDLSTAPQLKDALVEAADGNRDVIVDLSGVDYMDSSGFGALLGATKHLRPVSGALHLIGYNPTIERMLQITRLNTIFSLHESEAAARSAITEAQAAAADPVASA